MQEEQGKTLWGQIGAVQPFIGFLVSSGGSGEHRPVPNQDGRLEKGI
jgi:hypothetical protein